MSAHHGYALSLEGDFVTAEAKLKTAEGVLWSSLGPDRSEEHTSELQSQSTISYAVFCLKKKKKKREKKKKKKRKKNKKK